jgi:hypothetical protein
MDPSLSPLDTTTAQRLLRPVAWADRLVGWQLHRRLGALPIDLQSLPDVLALLTVTHPRLDLPGLARWCDTVLGDAPLARAIADAAAADTPPVEQHRQTARIIEARLLQAIDKLDDAELRA